ncbi:alpha/beta hydrolase [Companilactobacillus sp. RD055328]|uniref:alpha/beta hydrolase n=1 Tax=Companilactobacillus sp. RD055328 TaxID=2916634 RepID=UPI001FC88242|nr:alpha/beta hydrolase [Companilactobacillus sp. RD055328]GKQ43173.1 alpha/beta hydrolase [Companilactobacillus sp. RD055328]
MNKKKKLIVWVSSIVLIIVAILTAASLYFYQLAFVPGDKSFLETEKVTKADTEAKKWLKENKVVWNQTSATDNLKLVASYVPAKEKTKKTIVVAHGYMGKKEDLARQIKMFHDLGYNVLAPDDRAHGESEGNIIGYGWLDKDDYVKWIKKVIKQDGQDSQIALYGVSMGGSTVMMASGMNLPSQVKAIVEDCGYTSLKDELSYEAGNLYHIPPFPLVKTLSWVTQIKAGYDPYEASSVEQLKRNHLPMFFIHGGNDKFVPTEMVYRNYKATQGPKQIWVTKGVSHAKSFAKNPKLYENKVSKFLDKYFK